MQNVIFSTGGIIERLKNVKGYLNDADLARDLGVLPKKLAVWKLRNTVPLEELITFCRQEKINLEWALTGEGPSPEKKASPVITKINKLLPDLDEHDLQTVLKYIEERKLLAKINLFE